MDSILAATRLIVLEKGSNGLKMREITNVANVTISSIYQYFPHKGAIIEALAKSYLDDWQKQVTDSVAKISSGGEVATVVVQLMNDHYRRQKSDPVLRDILIGTVADKNLENMDMENTRVTHEILYAGFNRYFPQESWSMLKQSILLHMHLGSAAIRLALSIGEEAGNEIVEIYTSQMLRNLQDLMHPS